MKSLLPAWRAVEKATILALRLLGSTCINISVQNFDRPEQGAFYLYPDAVKPETHAAPSAGPAEALQLAKDYLQVGLAVGMVIAANVIGGVTITAGEYLQEQMSKMDEQEAQALSGAASPEKRAAIAEGFDRRRKNLLEQVAKFPPDAELDFK